jgi:nitrite reductase/ring-hydroxylating ferredoxin subunit
MPEEAIVLCRPQDLVDGGLAVPFDVVYGGLVQRAFAVRFKGQVRAYLNRCSHVAMEMDWQPNRFFDESGQWIVCATHGAVYDPLTGTCRGGPGRGPLIAIDISEDERAVYWYPRFNLKPVSF